MAQNLVMRQMDERTTNQEIRLLLWSPKMDILATAMDNGDVCLYRLQWHRVWAAPSHEDAACTALSWRPDGKLLASGYSSGLLSIRHIESKESIHTEQLDSEITCISWHDRPEGFNSKDEEMYSSLGSVSWDLMSRLPSLDKMYSYSDLKEEDLQDCRKLDDSNTVTILLVGTKTGSIYVLISGFLMCARLSVSDLIGAPAQIVSIVLASDLKTFSCIVKQEASARLVLVDCPIVATCQAELAVLSSKFNLIQGTIQYMEDTIKRIRESWENILREMDSKLASYANPNPPGTVAADLMELLLFGTFTQELEYFLFKDMTDKGLKKMGQSIEMSYSNIQRLVLRYLHPVSQSLHFQLGELVGLARASHRFPVIGVTEEVVLSALYSSGCFWSKAVELEQVIDQSIRNFQLFFRWLYTEILLKDGGEIPDELKKTSQQDALCIAEFIRRFENNPSSQPPTDNDPTQVNHVYLEQVGQYLKDADLSQTLNNSNNIWSQLLEDNPSLSAVPFILPVNSKASTVKQFNILATAVNKIFNGMSLDMTNETSVKLNLEFTPQGPPVRRLSLSSEGEDAGFPHVLQTAQRVEDELTQGAVSWDRTRILYWEQETGSDLMNATWLTLHPNTVIVDFSFYTKEILSVLLENGTQQILVQLPLTLLTLTPLPAHHNLDILNSNNIIEVGGRASCRDLENIRACSFAVSGPRKVSVLVFMSRKRQRIYDMEVEEDEDEDETFQSEGFSGSTEQTSQY